MRVYSDFIHQSFDFPTGNLGVKHGRLFFHGLDLLDIVQAYGTPVRLTFLPEISVRIAYAKSLFQAAFAKHNYRGKYIYCYCTKSSHFSFVLEKVLENDVHLETSSAFDMAIVKHLYASGKLTKAHYVICNGYKPRAYVDAISQLVNDGFTRNWPVLDSKEELIGYETRIQGASYDVALRMASDEEPNFEFYTSRLGFRYKDVMDYYEQVLKPSRATLRMLHFFVHTGMKDTEYFWAELNRFLETYCALRRCCETLSMLDIGGGLPVQNALNFDFDYSAMIDQIIETIYLICKKNNVPVPDVCTEFGSYTVAESGALVYAVMGEKLQNDKELWYMINGSFITHLPDTWGLNQKYILLPINHWDMPYHKVNLGGLTCDSMDYYNAEANASDVFMPVMPQNKQLYVGFFNTGAYQEALGGYGGIQHCLVPAPKHLICDVNKRGKTIIKHFAQEQDANAMLRILGYK